MQAFERWMKGRGWATRLGGVFAGGSRLRKVGGAERFMCMVLGEKGRAGSWYKIEKMLPTEEGRKLSHC